MPALIDLRKRIRSVRNTQQITKAMKTVSTAKFKKAQRVVLEGRPYSHSFSDILEHIAVWAEYYSHPLFEKREEQRVQALVITSDKGLCGAFNSNLLQKALSFFTEKAGSSELRLVLVGKKAFSFFKRHPFPVEMTYTDKMDKLTFGDIQKISRHMMHKFVFQETDAVYIAFNEFKSILSPKTRLVRLLPIVSPPVDEGQWLWAPTWEPEALRILNYLLPLYVDLQVYHYFRESQAAEHAARMMAMDNATNNAEELIEDLTLILNKIRQASITKELLEIMTAVEALAKK